MEDEERGVERGWTKKYKDHHLEFHGDRVHPFSARHNDFPKNEKWEVEMLRTHHKRARAAQDFGRLAIETSDQTCRRQQLVCCLLVKIGRLL